MNKNQVIRSIKSTSLVLKHTGLNLCELSICDRRQLNSNKFSYIAIEF